ncbi:MAG: LLM class flavin-dependent oxidoreductase [Pseudomonadales bacterium]|jgi:alkanesulfonate monooxygenase SsuD/methylene tetrahydromethanopterin reductase-like flavin-dependent oxidoreductase (luciferase family)|nr:LLM class flavin-dependent oxidoreductase [Pseudomonadales bacterium]MDP6470473.1 LLM class flavin-dependent oxidoreductase [Pseudomonadales bacterium]MDP6827775.1 LLM class flavin-dependent oxidoreductase [Pseudomonadales bacterium]MDP6973417.1 LLM class flavin-dependent oxidoreductase [Pseudomonadales bacterium]
MRFGVFYELQLPKPWDEQAEHRLIEEAIEQVQLADRLGIDNAWAVEHHFLDEYSHCSASDVFLTALAAKTEQIRVGFGIRQVIPNYNHPSRTAESVAMLDLISNGRVEFGIGEGATRLELHGYGIPTKNKRALSLEAAEQIANMMVMDPYPGFEGQGFSMPCRNVLPKPYQKPHPPMWLACTNRKTIEVAARNGLGALAFTFVDPEEAKTWADTYYSIIKSEQCVPLGHAVNANLAVVAGFSLHEDAEEGRRRGEDGFAFFRYAINALVANDIKPGRTTLWEEYEALRDRDLPTIAAPGIGTPEEFGTFIREFQEVGVDQIIFLQQGGKNRHEHICESLELFGRAVMPEFVEGREEREARKAAELAPYIEAALQRKQKMATLADDDIPVVFASREREAFYHKD